MGNAAVQAALGLAAATKDAAGSTLQVAGEAVDTGIEAGAEWAADAVDGADALFDAMAAVITPADSEEPGGEQVVPVPSAPEIDPATESANQALEDGEVGDSATYKDQRDNQSAHVGGDMSCSPTSFTMAMIDLHGGDEDAVRQKTIELLGDVGGNTDLEQTEELIIELLQKTDWKAAQKAKPKFFWGSDWASWANEQYGGAYYKDPNAQQYIGSLYPASTATAQDVMNVHDKSDWAKVSDALDGGKRATTEGAFTSAGHVVYLTAVDDSGIVLNDPFGCWVSPGVYLTNGLKVVPELQGPDLETFHRRAKRNGTLEAVYERAEPGYRQWGEQNYYTLDEAMGLNLGKWVSFLG